MSTQQRRYAIQQFTNSVPTLYIRNEVLQQFAKWLTYNSVLNMRRCNLLATMITQFASPVAKRRVGSLATIRIIASTS